MLCTICKLRKKFLLWRVEYSRGVIWYAPDKTLAMHIWKRGALNGHWQLPFFKTVHTLHDGMPNSDALMVLDEKNRNWYTSLSRTQQKSPESLSSPFFRDRKLGKRRRRDACSSYTRLWGHGGRSKAWGRFDRGRRRALAFSKRHVQSQLCAIRPYSEPTTTQSLRVVKTKEPRALFCNPKMFRMGQSRSLNLFIFGCGFPLSSLGDSLNEGKRRACLQYTVDFLPFFFVSL